MTPDQRESAANTLQRLLADRGEVLRIVWIARGVALLCLAVGINALQAALELDGWSWTAALFWGGVLLNALAMVDCLRRGEGTLHRWRRAIDELEQILDRA